MSHNVCLRVGCYLNTINKYRNYKVPLGDGNFLFRCFSLQLLATEEVHLEVRTLLVRFENLNQAAFEHYN